MNTKKKAEEESKIFENKEFIDPLDANILKEIKKTHHVGQNFRKIRERKHYTLTEVSEALRIGTRYLEAIEEGHSELLPERVYTLGFVRAYAQFLGENPTKCVELFKQQILQENQTLELNLPESLRKSTTPNKSYLLISIGIIFGVLLLLFIVNSFSREKQEIPDSALSDKTLMRSEKFDPAQDQFQKNISPLPKEENLPTSSLVVPNPVDVVLEKKDEGLQQLAKDISTLQQNIPKEALTLKLSCTEKSWVQIRDTQGEIIFVKTMLPGEIFDIPSKEGLILFTGNAGGLNIIRGEEVSKPLGRKGEVNQHILLDAQSLLPYLSAH